jgi:hydroxyacylglutathione hydrolase
MARHLEPDNPAIDDFLSVYDPNHVYSTLADELRINPYLRFNEGRIIRLLREMELPRGTEEERWKSLMSLE